MAVSAGMVLAFGQGLKYLIDQGFRAGDPRLLDQAVLVVFASTVVLALASFSRFYLVSWIGERVVADLRKQVFRHLMTLAPDFYEVTRTGDIISRLTTDTAVLQTVVGSSLPFAMRNGMMFLGAAGAAVRHQPAAHRHRRHRRAAGGDSHHRLRPAGAPAGARDAQAGRRDRGRGQ